jgi:hypothetical protein
MKPPQHAIDSSPVLVLPTDPAWDHDRIDAEIAEAEDPESHPWVLYQNGESRYDLTAKFSWAGGEASAKEYLGDGAVMFHLRRHRLAHMAEVQDAMDREFKTDGASALLGVWLKSAGYGIKEITGCDDLAFTPGPGSVPEKVLREIMDHHGGLPAITKIGAACWNISRPLSESEKKRSAS